MFKRYWTGAVEVVRDRTARVTELAQWKWYMTARPVLLNWRSGSGTWPHGPPCYWTGAVGVIRDRTARVSELAQWKWYVTAPPVRVTELAQWKWYVLLNWLSGSDTWQHGPCTTNKGSFLVTNSRNGTYHLVFLKYVHTHLE